jgi:hypothetical protein
LVDFDPYYIMGMAPWNVPLYEIVCCFGTNLHMNGTYLAAKDEFILKEHFKMWGKATFFYNSIISIIL